MRNRSCCICGRDGLDYWTYTGQHGIYGLVCLSCSKKLIFVRDKGGVTRPIYPRLFKKAIATYEAKKVLELL
jgi:hypothetical protein